MEEKVLDRDKYSLMGVTPKELYYRQNGLCYLELVYDDYGDGVKVPGAIYCTDGEEYAETGKMLNPTFECVQCMNRFFMEKFMRQEEKFMVTLFLIQHG